MLKILVYYAIMVKRQLAIDKGMNYRERERLYEKAYYK